MEWNAAKQALSCPYCGLVPKEQPANAAGAGIEHDLLTRWEGKLNG